MITFLIYFQAYMIPPIIPYLSTLFQVSPQIIGLTVPCYMIPYGISSLIFGYLSDRFGRKSIMVFSLFWVTILSLLTATTQSVTQLLLWRFFTGALASGTIPQSLTLIKECFSTEQQGRRLGWVFGAMVGGMAFGSVFGALLTSILGWRGTFIVIGCLLLLVSYQLWQQQHLLQSKLSSRNLPKQGFLKGYQNLFNSRRAKFTYGYIFLHGSFHSGLYTWLGFYLVQRYSLEQTQIGWSLLAYGISGLLTAPLIGRLADYYGRTTILILGLILAGLSSTVLIFSIPFWLTIFVTISLAVSYCMTQPLLTGMVTEFNSHQRGQAIGINVFLLFVSFGFGSYLFGELLEFSFAVALLIYSVVILTAALIAITQLAPKNS
ncbi:MFS transporter [Crocosphaera watsonii]|nr:MFS transporter [Crocosphaera sp.]